MNKLETVEKLLKELEHFEKSDYYVGYLDCVENLCEIFNIPATRINDFELNIKEKE